MRVRETPYQKEGIKTKMTKHRMNVTQLRWKRKQYHKRWLQPRFTYMWIILTRQNIAITSEPSDSTLSDQACKSITVIHIQFLTRFWECKTCTRKKRSSTKKCKWAVQQHSTMPTRRTWCINGPTQISSLSKRWACPFEGRRVWHLPVFNWRSFFEKKSRTGYTKC